MLVAFVGLQGVGKTLSMTAYGIIFSFFAKVPLYSVHTLKGVEYTKIDSFDQLLTVKNGIVLLDEIWLSADSRQSMRRSSVLFTRWLQQTRKKNLIVFYTAQLFSQVDYRLRGATHWIISVTRAVDAIWLTFVNGQTGLIGRRIRLDHPEMWYENYDTEEVGVQLFEEDADGRPIARQSVRQ